MQKKFGLSAVMLCTVLAAGCATNRSEVVLTTGAERPVVAVENNGRKVTVATVDDERVFQDGSADPSVPSLGFEGSAQSSAEVKARAVARKRNAFGKALGDVVLQEGQTVSKLVHEVTEQGLADAGFTVVPNGSGPDVTVVEVRIKQFWSWMTPGFWALTFENKIEANVAPKGYASTTINTYAQDSGQLGTDGAYIGIVGKGLADYRAKVMGWAKTAGF